jgi:acyl carrier protein
MTGGRTVQPDGFNEVEETVRGVLRDVLGISAERAAAFDEATPLFGALPELDSMAVAGVLTEIEDRLHILIEDDEVDGEMLESFGALRRFAEAKVGAKKGT